MKDLLINQSSAVRTNVLPEVYSKIKSVEPDFSSVRHYKTDIIEWLKPVVDLTGFYVYPMNGITEGLNWWYDKEQRSVEMATGDYQWITSTIRNNDKIFYQSVPSAIDGNIIEVKRDMPVALDLAYVGSTGVRKIEIPDNVEFAFYSLSKSFGVRNIRTGWFFSRKEDKKLDSLISSAKYYNYYAHDVAECIINNFDIDFVHKFLYHKQIEICRQLDFVPSDSVWLACTTNDDYKKFRRFENKARICLAGVY